MVVQNNLDIGDTRKGILLEPFIHQVGGHMSMMKYDDYTVCKPLVSQEQRFYETLPTAMKQFTPHYKGAISVRLKKDSMGNLSLLASPQMDNHTSLDNVSKEHSVTIWQNLNQANTSKRDHTFVTWNHSPLTNVIEDSCQGKVLLQTNLQNHQDVSSLMEDANGNQEEKTSFNPWGLYCHRQHLNRISSKYSENKRHQFLMLENVVSKYKYPCILDLKMGTRQHGDDASEEKKVRQIKKCEQSTSASLGVRICGMQVYQADTVQYICKNKYYGRKLSPDGFKQALCQFLHNGNRFRTDLVEPILFQLNALLSTIKEQNSYRFFSSSLLINYEGLEKAVPLDSHTQGNDQNTGCSVAHGSSHPKVDVRMIDFAHTTYKDSRYEGPDHGYIFGLENLIKTIQSIPVGE